MLGRVVYLRAGDIVRRVGEGVAPAPAQAVFPTPLQFHLGAPHRDRVGVFEIEPAIRGDALRDEILNLIVEERAGEAVVLREGLFPDHFVGADRFRLEVAIDRVGGGLVFGLVGVGHAIGLAVEELERRGRPGIVNERGPRIDGAAEGAEVVVARAGVEGEVRADAEFILHIQARTGAGGAGLDVGERGTHVVIPLPALDVTARLHAERHAMLLAENLAHLHLPAPEPGARMIHVEGHARMRRGRESPQPVR